MKKGMEESDTEGVAIHGGPDHASASARATAKRWIGVPAGRLWSREISVSGCRRCPNEWKATSLTALSRVVGGPRVVREPLHAGSLHAREPGDPTLARPADRGRAAQGRLVPYAWDVRGWEVGSPRSTCEAAEQGDRCGGGGGKGARRGEPGRHDTPRTQSRVRRATRAGPGAPQGCRGSRGVDHVPPRRVKSRAVVYEASVRRSSRQPSS